MRSGAQSFRPLIRVEKPRSVNPALPGCSGKCRLMAGEDMASGNFAIGRQALLPEEQDVL
jgi:hypothetical protein